MTLTTPMISKSTRLNATGRLREEDSGGQWSVAGVRRSGYQAEEEEIRQPGGSEEEGSSRTTGTT